MYARSSCQLQQVEIKPKRKLFYRTPWCDMLGCCSGDTLDVLHLYYPLCIIAEEVHKLTSYLGKHRSSDTAPHLLDLIAMTQDEKDLFHSYVRSAMAKVFTPLGKHTKQVDKAYLWEVNCRTIVVKDDETEPIEYHKGDYVVIGGKLYLASGDGDTSTMENLGETPDFRESVHYIIQWPKRLNPNYIEPLEQAVFEALCYYIIWRWLLSAYPDEAKTYQALFEDALDDIRRNSSRLIPVIVDRIPRVF